MPYEKLKVEILEAREERDERRWRVLKQAPQALVQFSLNIPGAEKQPAGARELFLWGLRQILELLPRVESCSQGVDALGHWALLGSFNAADKLKRQLLPLEGLAPHGRLLDIDVFDPRGRQIGRQRLGMPPRNCLLCDCPAVDCIRQQRHSPAELKAAVDDILARFRA